MLSYPGFIVKRNEQNLNLVLVIQKRLNKLGCGPLAVTGDFDDATVSAVKLFQSRNTDQDHQTLKIDGEIGPSTWGAMFGWDTIPKIAPVPEDSFFGTLLDIAKSQRGVRELPQNRGPEVTAYLKSTGLDAGWAWCAAFVYWCFREAAAKRGVKNPVVRTAGVLDHWARAKNVPKVRRITRDEALNDPRLIRAGAVFVMDFGQGRGHTGLVLEVMGAKIKTIEGNTGPDPLTPEEDREGDGVYFRTRPIRSVKGFIDYHEADFSLLPEVIENKSLVPSDLRADYLLRFANCKIHAPHRGLINLLVERVLQHRGRYELAAEPLDIPWYFAAIVHSLEAAGNFTKHLHNGDPLTERTVQVPAGRPRQGTPPFEWEFSAQDALAFKKLNEWKDWSVGGLLYQFEKYNGMGYRRKNIPSPYLWSFSDQYVKGKFVQDGKFDPEAVSKQCGAAVLLKALAERGEIELPNPF